MSSPVNNLFHDRRFRLVLDHALHGEAYAAACGAVMYRKHEISGGLCPVLAVRVPWGRILGGDPGPCVDDCLARGSELDVVTILHRPVQVVSDHILGIRRLTDVENAGFGVVDPAMITVVVNKTFSGWIVICDRPARLEA